MSYQDKAKKSIYENNTANTWNSAKKTLPMWKYNKHAQFIYGYCTCKYLNTYENFWENFSDKLRT